MRFAPRGISRRGVAWLLVAGGLAAIALAALPSVASSGSSDAFGYKQFLLLAAGVACAAAGVLILSGGLSRLRPGPLVDAGSEERWSVLARDPVVLGAAALALAGMVLYGLFGGARFEIDGYEPIGRDFAGWWQNAAAAGTLRTPGYPLFLSLHYSLGLGNDAVRVTQAVLLAATLVVTAVLAGDVGGRRAARAAALAYLAYLPWLTFAAVGLTEPLSVPLTTAACLAVVAAVRRPEHRLWFAALATALATVGTLVRPGSAIYLVVVGLAVVLLPGTLRARAATAAVVVLVAAGLFGPWAGRNLALLGEPSLLGNGGAYPLVLGTHLPMDKDIGEHSAFRRSYRFFSGTRPDGFTPAVAAQTDPWEQLRTNLTERPLDLVWARAVAQFQMWFWPQEARVQVNGPAVVPYPILMAIHLVLLFAGLVGLARARATLVGRLGLGFFAATLALYLLYWTTPRYVLPIMPLLLAGAGIAFAAVRRPSAAAVSRVPADVAR